jgi:hypothetical protein
MLPFTHEQFLDVFARYNVAVWPMQVVVYALAAAMITVLVRPGPLSGRLIGGGLAAMWLWTGIGYHWMFFAGINKAAWLFGALFVAQGMLLFLVADVQGRLSFAPSNNLSSWVGWGFVAYALVIYPLIGVATGSEYPGMPMFGITPCPVTIFTFGLFLLARAAVPWWLLIIPFIWSLIGGSAAVLLHVPQDWFLLFSGIAVVPIVLRGRRQHTLATT